ncbi:glycoside hydrolase family 88 protein [Marinimicrobium sp. C6131]|uniref:glycoside hydrolase family 88/105 protein n=1 Tax=Marinimicrobium sp. C6131 TaxID=3022676 RepID=UPI00223DD81B|nr:glycoside hydrolase family 88 protein [Marinimicrobium sp. C6131]UZJ44967.1 glycoside hydrolase family 88 protein [Marinimicrobium sp. C6131]
MHQPIRKITTEIISNRFFRGFALSVLCLSGSQATAQTGDTAGPLHLLPAEYPTPYGAPEVESIKAVLDRVHAFLDENSASIIVDADTGKVITDPEAIKGNIALGEGAFHITGYEWGVTYAGMLLASEATGEPYYADYTNTRLKLIADIAANHGADDPRRSPIRSVLNPDSLDDSGSLAAAMIKAKMNGLDAPVEPLISNFLEYISEEQFRLDDGTLARNRPQDNTLWLDDLFMSVPALAQMGHYSGERRYFDDAVKQIEQFSERMFNEDQGLYMHGWVQGMEDHPEFYWGRANGWAVMAMVELLEVLPEDHPGYAGVLDQLRAHIRGLVQYQDGTGLWHQLLDRNDTYLETSATAIFAYSMARAINRGYIDKKAYSPAVLLAWNAVATQVNDAGQVEGTCVGTGMGFDPAFYYYRPVHLYAAHGYGPVLLAGAEVILTLKDNEFEINDSSLQLKE